MDGGSGSTAAGDPGEEKTWYLRRVDVFRGLSDDEIEQLGAMLELRVFSAGELLVAPDTPRRQVYVVKTGAVRLFHRGPDGRVITAGTVERGGLLGVSSLFNGTAQDGFLLAEAASEVVACLGDGWSFLRAITRWPSVLLTLAEQLGAQLVQVEQQIGAVAAADARTRLARALYQLARDAGESLPGDGRLIRLTPTHATLAAHIGASRETVTRALAALEAGGYIRRHGRRTVLPNPARLVTDFGLPGGD